MQASTPLSRAQIQTAMGRLEPRLSEGIRRLTSLLLEKIDANGRANVKQLHDHLFPAAADAKTASAQLNNLLKNIQAAAHANGMQLDFDFEGSKQKGAAYRTLKFMGPPPMLLADTETLNAIPLAERVEGQTAELLTPDEHTVVVLTFNQHEYNAVRKHLWPHASQPPGTQHQTVQLYDLGLHGNTQVLHHHSRQGNRESQKAATTILGAVHPDAIIAVGIAFGVGRNKQHIGDVLVSTYVLDYETGKVNSTGSITPRGARPEASYRWVEALRQLHTRNENTTNKTTWPTLHFGGVLSGEKLVDNINYRDSLLALSGQDDVFGGEMEGAGLHTAVKGTSCDWLVLKAICDWADGHKSQDKERRQQDAADNAAHVLKTLLDSSTVYPGSPKRSPQSTEPISFQNKPKELMQRAKLSEVDSHAYLVCNQAARHVSLETIQAPSANDPHDSQDKTNQIIAFDDILAWAKQDDGPPLYALLGEYGMGKTTTCQRVFEHIRKEHAAGTMDRPALYFDLRKVERLSSGSGTHAGQVPSLQEAIEDCLKHGYLSDGPEPPSYAHVLHSIDQGAIVIFDGLDEVLSRLQDKQGLTFTQNLLRVLPDAAARQGIGSATQRSPKVLLSCRTQFFRTLAEQDNHLTGEHRGAQPARQYRAIVLRPFSVEQVRAYLQATLPGADINQLMQRIASVHNLTDLSKRPFTLKLVVKFLPHIEQWIKAGRTVTGATLYRQVAREWLIRDKEKQSFQPEDKEKLAADLAAHLWHQGKRGLTAKALETWLGNWLRAQDPGADFHTIPRELLQQDLRNATFLRRIDTQDDQANSTSSRFEFSHSSLQEFFLADHLAQAALQAASDLAAGETTAAASLIQRWAGPMPSTETLDFLGQILLEQSPANTTQAITQILNQWRRSYRPQASELLLQYSLSAPPQAPRALLAGFGLAGAQLRGWCFEGEADQALDMASCDFTGADLRDARFSHALLDNTQFANARLDAASFVHCRLRSSQWNAAQCAGTVWRHCQLDGSNLHSTAHSYRAQTVACTGVSQASWQGVTTEPDWIPTPEAAIPARLAIFQGHGMFVQTAVFSPDGQHVLSGGLDNTLKLWDARTRELLRSYSGHASGISSVAFSPDGLCLLSGSHDRTLKLWDPQTGELLRTFSGHEERVNSVAFSPDGRHLLSGGNDRTLKLWDPQTGELLRTFSGHEERVNTVAFSPDGQHLLSGGNDNTLKLWDVRTGELLRSISGHEGWISSVTFSPDGRHLISGSFDQTIKLWGSHTGELLRSFADGSSGITSVAITSDGLRLLSGSGDSTLKLWDVRTGELLRSFSGHTGRISNVAFSPNGQRMLSCSWDNTLKLWDSQSIEKLCSFTAHENWVSGVAFSPDGQFLVSGGGDSALKLWDNRSSELLHALDGHEGRITTVAFSPDGQLLVSGSLDSTLKLWNAATGEMLRNITAHKNWVSSVAFSPDGLRLLSGGGDDTLKLWNAHTGDILRSFIAHKSWVSCVAFSPDGLFLLSGGWDNTVKLWDAHTGELLRSFTGFEDRVSSLAFSPEGKRLLTGGLDKTLKLWDAKTGALLRSFEGHEGGISSAAFSPDGLHLISGSFDKTLKLWDAHTGELKHTFTGHDGGVSSVAFSPDGQRLLSGGWDCTLKLWDAHTGELLQTHWAYTPPQQRAEHGRRSGPQHSHAVWTSTKDEHGVRHDRLLSASGDAWRYLGWQPDWAHIDTHGAAIPMALLRLPIGEYPTSAPPQA